MNKITKIDEYIEIKSPSSAKLIEDKTAVIHLSTNKGYKKKTQKRSIVGFCYWRIILVEVNGPLALARGGGFWSTTILSR